MVDDKAGPVDTNAQGLKIRASAVLGVDLDVDLVTDVVKTTRCSVSIGGGSTQDQKIVNLHRNDWKTSANTRGRMALSQVLRGCS